MIRCRVWCRTPICGESQRMPAASRDVSNEHVLQVDDAGGRCLIEGCAVAKLPKVVDAPGPDFSLPAAISLFCSLKDGALPCRRPSNSMSAAKQAGRLQERRA